VLYVTLGVSLASYGLVYAALLALAPALPLLRARPWRHVQTFASMAATLAIARSPASMVRRRPIPPPAGGVGHPRGCSADTAVSCAQGCLAPQHDGLHDFSR